MQPRRKITQDNLDQIIRQHALWWNGRPGGRQAVLSRLDLGGLDFGGKCLAKVDFSGAYLGKARLAAANLYSADFREASLDGAILTHANLQQAVFVRTTLVQANLEHANATAANFCRADLSSAEFSNATLGGVNLSHADLAIANLSWAKLSQANLEGAGLQRANLSYANMTAARVGAADFSQANLHGANCAGVDFTTATMDAAIISDAILTLPFCRLDLGGSTQCGTWPIMIGRHKTTIGCRQGKNTDWLRWTPRSDAIRDMHGDAVNFWKIYGPTVKAAIEATMRLAGTWSDTHTKAPRAKKVAKKSTKTPTKRSKK